MQITDPTDLLKTRRYPRNLQSVGSMTHQLSALKQALSLGATLQRYGAKKGTKSISRRGDQGGEIKQERFLSWFLTRGRILNRRRMGKEELVTSGEGLHRQEWKYGNMLRKCEEKEISR